jgi:DNA-binding IclR family transcriptional regulator
VSEGLLTFDPASKLYHLGIEMYYLGTKTQEFHVIDIFRPLIKQIALETDDTVFLLIRPGYDVLCVDLMQGKFPIRAIEVSIGDRYQRENSGSEHL